ncbi:hypothetical protein HDU80_007982 [Chytriomyces hyalinus]|nr:hypothetical protein HDU80_007982 [Chytriomyces hyalinus]
MPSQTVAPTDLEAASCPAYPQGVSINTFKGKPYDLLAETKGKVVLFVNVASRCGFTGQYDGLEALYKKYKSQGLLVIGIPSNDFKQEPADGESCRLNFGVTFPILEKCHVNGEEQHELYRNLKAQKSRIIGRGIIWNFEKILVGRNGRVVDRYHPSLQPLALEPWIEKELGLAKATALSSIWYAFKRGKEHFVAVFLFVILALFSGSEYRRDFYCR